MRWFTISFIALFVHVQCQLQSAHDFVNKLSWFEQYETDIDMTTSFPGISNSLTYGKLTPDWQEELPDNEIKLLTEQVKAPVKREVIEPNTTEQVLTTVKSSEYDEDLYSTTATTETIEDTTTGVEQHSNISLDAQDFPGIIQYFSNKYDRPQIKIALNISQNLLPLQADNKSTLIKPTKYHYYPHNQHIYILPECAIQQVCNAVYIRLNWTQPLCACPSRYRDPCSASLNTDDLHTTELITDATTRRALTLVKTCESTTDMRMCRNFREWSLLALQNIRTGKSHYLIICRCPYDKILEGPISHDQPTYANVPGIRVYGMMCVKSKQDQKNTRYSKTMTDDPEFPWDTVNQMISTVNWN